MKSPRRIALLGILALLATASAWAQSPAMPFHSPDAAVTPTTNPSLSVSPDARMLLDEMTQAYAGLKSLSVAGKLTSNFDIDGQKDSQQSEFTAIWGAGGKFRHELHGDAVLGNTGDKVYAFIVAENAYITHDAPAAVNLDSLDTAIARVLRGQNPSLALALCGNAEKELLDGAQTVEKVADVIVNAAACPALRISTPDRDLTVAVDPRTHLMRWTSVDMTKLVRQKGAHDVKSALLTYDYATTNTAPINASQFAWSPPAGAQEMQQDSGAGAQAPDLEGKIAPAFTLSGLDGNQVNSADFKGSVVVVDFWATWCGPCVASLPQLDEIYKSLKSSGLKVYALDQQEDKPTVQKWVTDNKLTIPALLDSDGKVGQAYGAQAIPETVVIGKDGKIRKVLVGAGPENEQALRDAINKALAEK
jgi:peroxiredoxin